MKIHQLLPAVVAGILCCVTSAQAHPGHGGDSAPNGLLHYVTEPMHVAMLVSTVVLAVFCLRFIWQRTRSVENVPHESHDV